MPEATMRPVFMAPYDHDHWHPLGWGPEHSSRWEADCRYCGSPTVQVDGTGVAVHERCAAAELRQQLEATTNRLDLADAGVGVDRAPRCATCGTDQPARDMQPPPCRHCLQRVPWHHDCDTAYCPHCGVPLPGQQKRASHGELPEAS